MIASDCVSCRVAVVAAAAPGATADTAAYDSLNCSLLRQMHRHVVVGQALERQRDAHAVRGRRAEVVVELHRTGLRRDGRLTHRDLAACPGRRWRLPSRRRAPPRPTPAGVPVKIRSPGCSVQAATSCSIVSSTLQISSRRSPFCAAAPLTESVIAPSSSSTGARHRHAAGRSAPTCSKALPMHHGRPCFFISFCRSRRVMSRPTA